MDDLADFISARLGEDETAAYGLCGNGLHLARWAVSGDSVFVGTEPLPGQPVAHAWDDRVKQHVARHDPARVLREVAAKRAILAAHAPVTATGGLYEDQRVCTSCGAASDDWWYATAWPCATVRLLAAIWSDHGGYRPEWAPGHG